jgi:hypothetical protein
MIEIGTEVTRGKGLKKGSPPKNKVIKIIHLIWRAVVKKS